MPHPASQIELRSGLTFPIATSMANSSSAR